MSVEFVKRAYMEKLLMKARSGNTTEKLASCDSFFGLRSTLVTSVVAKRVVIVECTISDCTSGSVAFDASRMT